MASAQPFIEKKLQQRPALLISKTYVPECKIIIEILEKYNLNSENGEGTFEVVNIECRQDCSQIETYLHALSLLDRREVPLLFVNGRYFGNYEMLLRTHNDGSLAGLLKKKGVECATPCA